MDLDTRRDTERERVERKERRKEKAKARRKEERKARERATAGRSWWHGHHDQRWTEPFRGCCGHCWKWGHRKAQCPQWQGRRPMELGAMVTHPSQSVVSDPGSSASQRVQAVNSSGSLSPLSVGLQNLLDDEEDWPDEWWVRFGERLDGRLTR